jgi:hypothetical protein
MGPGAEAGTTHNLMRQRSIQFSTANAVIATRSPAMTSKRAFAFPRRDSPELWIYFPPEEGVGTPGAQCTRSLVGR